MKKMYLFEIPPKQRPILTQQDEITTDDYSPDPVSSLEEEGGLGTKGGATEAFPRSIENDGNEDEPIDD